MLTCLLFVSLITLYRRLMSVLGRIDRKPRKQATPWPLFGLKTYCWLITRSHHQFCLYEGKYLSAHKTTL